MTQPVDLRSDTVTRPTPEMRQAIATAEVGDDVFGDDPTVLRLQAHVAELFGKEAALFVPSGSMANQIALLCTTRPGDHVIVPTGAHVVHYEAGAGGAIAGVQFCELGSAGLYDLDALEAHIQPDDHHCPPTALITIENTHNRAGGRVVPTAHIADIAALARAHELHFHMDGARLFNAIATGIDPKAAVQHVDSLSICMSKGLGAPVGSVLIGTEDFIHRAHRFRKMMGGAMRQVGILAAAGLHAIQHHAGRLVQDHRRALDLAHGFAALDGAAVDLESVQTNIVYVQLDPAGIDGRSFVERAAAEQVLCYATARHTVRFVTHLDVDDRGIQVALAAARAILGN